MAEELAAVADSLWEMRGGNAATVAAAGHSKSPRRQSPGQYQQDGSNGLCFHHYSYGHQATRCKQPCIFQGNGQPPAATEPLQSTAKSADGCPRLHPTTRLFLPECTIIHMFSDHSKLCFIRVDKSNKDFLVDTGTTLSLAPFQSDAIATGPKLQAVNKQAIKMWNFMNTVVKFNGNEHTFAFLRAFPIVGLEFL
jgi:hypothetical protein